MASEKTKEGFFLCPFSDCDYSTTRVYEWRVHLNRIKALSGNEVHPINDPLWNTWKNELKINQRPRNLTETEKKV